MAANINYTREDGTTGTIAMLAPVEVVIAADKSFIQVTGGDPIELEYGCVPDHPFYIRWINGLGGYDYKMWSRRKTYEEDISDLVVVQKSDGSQESIYADGYVYVTVGEDALPEDIFAPLKKLARSPRIEWWNEERQMWFVIVVDGDSAQVWDSDSGLGSVEFTFQLPRINMQY